MGMIDDIMKALDRWEVWRDLQQVPTKMEALERRIAELETKLGGKWPGDVCPYCGAQAFRLERTDMLGKRETWKCGECAQTQEFRFDLPGRKPPQISGR